MIDKKTLEVLKALSDFMYMADTEHSTEYELYENAKKVIEKNFPEYKIKERPYLGL